jgi:hypothetical protein
MPCIFLAASALRRLEMSYRLSIDGQPDEIGGKVEPVDSETSIVEACKLMRSSGASRLLVTTRENGRVIPIGLLDPRDIVTRVIAAELDATVLTVGDVTWPCSMPPHGLTGSAQVDRL